MGSSPKKQDYEPTASDRANASVAMAEYNFFKENYDPLLQQMRDQSMDEDQARVLRARANADTRQALTNPGYRSTQWQNYAGDLSQALQGQLGIAEKSGLQIQNQMRTNVLGTGRGQVADAQTGMGQASRLETGVALNRARANQQVAQSKLNAGVQLASTAVGQGIRNYSQTGNAFTPGIGQMDEQGNFSYRPASNMRERFTVGSRTLGGAV